MYIKSPLWQTSLCPCHSRHAFASETKVKPWPSTSLEVHHSLFCSAVFGLLQYSVSCHDWYLRYWPMSKLCCFISYSFRYHSSSSHPCQYLFIFIVSVHEFVFNLFNFSCTMKSPPSHIIIRTHLISYHFALEFFSSLYFYGANCYMLTSVFLLLGNLTTMPRVCVPSDNSYTRYRTLIPTRYTDCSAAAVRVSSERTMSCILL